MKPEKNNMRQVTAYSSIARKVNLFSRAVCHDILEFSARVLATFPCGSLRFGAFPFEILLGSCDRRM
jgi:hypothetical protein